MQRSLKLALVDPKLLEHRDIGKSAVDPKHIEYRDLGKNVKDVAKAETSLDMRQLLDNPSLPVDVKMKMYGQLLNRFLNVNEQGVQPQQLLPSINYTEPTRVATFAADAAADDTPKKKSKKSKKPIAVAAAADSSTSATPIKANRKSSRKPKPKFQQTGRGWVGF